MKNRSQWASNLGFVLATAGAAIGLGNLWKFPYLMGKNGGFQFLVAYLVFIIILGVPVMICEMSLGRLTEKNPVGAYASINKKAGIIGKFGIICAFIILSYYSVIGGWIIKYIVSYATTAAAPADFGAYTAQPVEPVIWHLVFMACTAYICYKGTKGIEKASSIMMPGLFIIMLIIIVRSLTLPGAIDGLRFIFVPSGDAFHVSSISAALGQVFYSLSLCMGITITYGSYLNKRENIPANAVKVASLDTVIAVLAGIAIFPAVFAFDMEPGSGPTLIFGTLPKVFENIAGGWIFALLFFILVFLAAVTSAIALLECIIAYAIDDLHWSRHKAVLVVGTLIALLGIPSSLAFGPLSNFTILNYNFFDLMCMLTDNIFMPIGGIMMCIFIGWIWGPQHLVKEVEQNGVVFTLKKAWIVCIKYITPVLVAVVTITGFLAIYQTVFGA